MGYSGHTKGPVINYVEGGYKKEKRVSKTYASPPPLVKTRLRIEHGGLGVKRDALFKEL